VEDICQAIKQCRRILGTKATMRFVIFLVVAVERLRKTEYMTQTAQRRYLDAGRVLTTLKTKYNSSSHYGVVLAM